MPDYSSWQQVAGYFDGDGTIGFSDLSNLPYKVGLSLVFVDQSYDQIRTVRDFLHRNGIRTSNILRHYKKSAFLIAVSSHEAVKRMLREMLPFLHKKETEAKAALDYLEGRTTGNEMITIFKREVDAGRRERRQHSISIGVPYTRVQGLALMKQNRQTTFRDAFGRFRSKVSADDYVTIRNKYFDGGKKLADLAREFHQYSRETIRRVLGKGRGYVGVKGIGRVNTADTTIREPQPATI